MSKDPRIVTCMCGKPMTLQQLDGDPWAYWYHEDGTNTGTTDEDKYEHLPVLCENCSVPLEYVVDKNPRFEHRPERIIVRQVACDNAEPRIAYYGNPQDRTIHLVKVWSWDLRKYIKKEETDE